MREERRSEHLQDPIGMQNLPQIQNGNVESSSTRGDLEKDNEERIVVKEDGNEEFTLKTFALITGLNCVGGIDDFKFNTKEPNRLIVQYLGGNEFIRKSDLMSRFTKKVWADNEDDALKFAILYFIHTYVYSGERTSKRIHFDLIESGRYRQ
ncbi:hypothetical protein KY290_022528 [Solanum tuberosum]|uniref:DUF1985 domain-containing protein n=1 Tax=Solanum tuberosum TaxID=4113 RepID=A0ABQ7V4M3_SOLTU|nr:hypothetical protein KY284_021431 [Solanum tuberosum]KAH0759035.1 hypothetical protein KY290_022528 [Solanum tuberosum]